MLLYSVIENRRMESVRAIQFFFQLKRVDKMCSEASLTFHTRETSTKHQSEIASIRHSLAKSEAKKSLSAIFY